ncbi:RNA polymerase sigma24 factor [Rhizocola hellebori]|uniref:RNA polymerase sigma24 factor n=1 Tax=Rhizocola hellebori TaxID=1392758 RepID=A0A8J3QBR2_9ACTN|nr:SigE family RNA polymerase sigma factor [Rhizocola hellebori]GIH07651.1 RNA polymerase sigma24 factor [Rhizocola hellebori]
MKDAEYTDFVSARLESLRRLAFLLCGDAHRADDLVQQAITKLYVRWRKLADVANLDQYLRTILLREFIDERRRSWAKVRLVAQAPEAAARSDDAAARLDLRAALLQLPKRQRAVVVLRFLSDLSVDDTAAALGCSAGTVKSQTADGLAKLRRLLGDELIAVASGRG